ncbi:PREDICTED: butyrophilin subfamily 1 member A1-like [Elephantulus edwardii]|uniref:butyrophilin subfamily 1 member A1-like n=1 Tax=Elephantulus edwardii TaxID=28737 RepID=UPI0003F0787D|nr:PREDICTED: butyrophilin subfamily 1 member A1-like [Elephantulus edwardii]
MGLLIFLAAYFAKKEHSANLQKKKETESLQRAKEKHRHIKEAALKDRDALQAELDQRKKIYQAGPVTLDPSSAHSNLDLSQDNKRLTWKDICKSMSLEQCSVLGLEGITSGLWYWEVEVKDEHRSEWTVGVCRENVVRKGFYWERSEKGFWVVGRFLYYFCVFTSSLTELTLRQFPSRVGIFLDYDEGDISFYNMTDGSHIFSFSEASFSGTLLPYFMFMSGDITLAICSTADGSEGLTEPIHKPLTEPVWTDPEVLKRSGNSLNFSYITTTKNPHGAPSYSARDGVYMLELTP